MRRTIHTGTDMTETQIKILSNAVQTYGKNHQVDIAIEEMSELTKALLKDRRNIGAIDDVLEELADVYIMICQLMMIFNIDTEMLDNQIDYKIRRLQRRIVEVSEK